MGNSADRAWQLSQLVEGVSTAFNPSHGSLSCAFPNLRCCPRCWLFSCLGVYFHLRISPKEHQKERCDRIMVAALLHCFLWCASNYSVVGRIICHSSHDNARTNVCQRFFAENFFLLMPLLDRIASTRNQYEDSGTSNLSKKTRSGS